MAEPQAKRAKPSAAALPFRADLLSGKKALVTGGNDGIGEAITCALVRQLARLEMHATTSPSATFASASQTKWSSATVDGRYSTVDGYVQHTAKYFKLLTVAACAEKIRATRDRNSPCGCGGQVGVGAEVVVIARSHEKFEAMLARASHPEMKDRTHFITADFASADETTTAAAKALEWAGGCLDIVVNNAGVAMLNPLEDLSLEQWDTTMQVNMRAPFLIAQACGRAMIARGAGGKVVNVSSMASTVGLAGHGAYCSSKAALDGLTRVMAVEWAKHNITCNSVGPTVIMTDMGRKNWSDPAKCDPMLNRIPLGRFGEPHEVAHLVVYLCAPSADLICGQALLLDGGATATGV